MTVGVTVVSTADLGVYDKRLASYGAGGLRLWPQGIGRGPCITMDPQDWVVIRAQMDAAAQRHAAEFGED